MSQFELSSAWSHKHRGVTFGLESRLAGSDKHLGAINIPE